MASKSSVALNPDFGYVKVRVTPSAPDIMTWRVLTTTALTRFGGTSGAAVQLDILQWDAETCVLRCPTPRLKFVQAALNIEMDGQYLRVESASSFLAGLA